MAYLWCLIVVSLAALAGPSLAANTISRELAELLTEMKQGTRHYQAHKVDGSPPLAPDPEERDAPPLSSEPSEKDSGMPPNDKEAGSMDGARNGHSAKNFGDFTNILPPNVRDAGSMAGARNRDSAKDLDDFTNILPGAGKEDDFRVHGQRIDMVYHGGPTPAQVAERVQERKRVAALSKEEAEVELKKIAQDNEKQDFTWAVDKAMKEMKETRGEEFYRDFRRETRSQNKDTKKMYVCFFCDAGCVAESASFGQLESLEASFAQKFAAVGVEVKVGLNIKPGILVQYALYLQGHLTDRGLNDIARASDTFWDVGNLYVQVRDLGCDASVLAVSEDDSLFVYIASIRGVAKFGQICQENYSLCQVLSNSGLTSNIMMHEIGHMLGMYHDNGATEPSYTNPGLVPVIEAEYPDEYQALLDNCDQADAGCAAGSATCIMAPMVSGSQTSAFSSCSTKYAEMLYKMADIFPAFYDVSCIS